MITATQKPQAARRITSENRGPFVLFFALAWEDDDSGYDPNDILDEAGSSDFDADDDPYGDDFDDLDGDDGEEEEDDLDYEDEDDDFDD